VKNEQGKNMKFTRKPPPICEKCQKAKSILFAKNADRCIWRCRDCDKEVLEELPEGKIKIIPDNVEDKQVAQSMETLFNWKIVKSKSDRHPIYGHPMGKILCRNMKEAEEYIEKTEFTDCFIEDY
jgi:ribosomal protein L37AE/L43A